MSSGRILLIPVSGRMRVGGMTQPETAPVLTPAERLRGQRYALLANLLAGSQFIMQGVIMMLYANDVLGFTPRRISYVLAVVPLVALLRLAFLGYVRSIGKIRLLTVTAVLRLVSVLLMMAIPAAWLSFPLFLSILLLFSLSAQLGAGVVWQPLIRDITTLEDRGRFFARMRFCFTMVSALVSMVIPLVVGEQITELQFKGLLLVVVAGVVNNLFWVRRIPEVRHQPEAQRAGRHFGAMGRALVSSRLLRGPLLIACIFVVMGLPIYPIYLKQMLHVPSSLISWCLFAATLGGTFSLLLWGRVADQIGFKPMLKGLLYLSILVLPTHLLITPFDATLGYDLHEWVAVAVLLLHAFVGGILGAGVGIAMTTIQHAFVRSEDSLEAMNLFQGASMLVASLFALLAGVLLENVAIPLGIASHLDGWIYLDAVRIYVMVSGVVGSLGIIRVLRSFPNSRPYFDVNDFFAALGGSPWRVAYAQRQVYHPDEATRIQTADWMGRQSSPLVLDSLIGLLDDPSYDVRVAAIRALAPTGAALAGEHLLAALNDPARQSVADHVAWALGELGYAPALDELRTHLAPAYAVRTRAMAARALGKLGDDAAAPALEALLTEENLHTSQHLVSSACRALLRLGHTEQMGRVFHMLNGLSTREDRYELMDVLCVHLGISNEWVLKTDSATSPRQALLDYISLKSGSWQRAHGEVVAHVQASDFAPLQRAFVEASEQAGSDPVRAGLRDALSETAQWGPVAVMASGWLLLGE